MIRTAEGFLIVLLGSSIFNPMKYKRIASLKFHTKLVLLSEMDRQ
jgi:hypothetical protein